MPNPVRCLWLSLTVLVSHPLALLTVEPLPDSHFLFCFGSFAYLGPGFLDPSLVFFHSFVFVCVVAPPSGFNPFFGFLSVLVSSLVVLSVSPQLPTLRLFSLLLLSVSVSVSGPPPLSLFVSFSFPL